MNVLRQPKKAAASIILVGSKVAEETDKVLKRLAAITDLIIIGIERGVDYDKFTSLYQGCAWCGLQDNNITETFKFALEYDFEIFGNHTTYLLGVDKELEWGGIDMVGLQENLVAPVLAPICRIAEKTADELREIYFKPKSNPWWPFGEPGKDETNKYASHSLSSSLVMLKKPTAKNIVELSKDTIRTFTSPTDWIASTIVREGIEHLNINPWDEIL